MEIWLNSLMKYITKMRTIVRFCGVLSLYLLVLILLEGLFTFGQAFNFEKYNTIGWIVQGLLIVVCIYVTSESMKDDI